LKAQLTALADLIKPSSVNTDNADDGAVEDDLDEDELEILRDAGVILRSRSNLGKGGKKPKHIVFVDDEEEGAFHTLRFLPRI
jgi:U3 small nucleolar RNA-associated protein 11